MRFFHEGQFEGYRLHVPVHLARAPIEPVDTDLQAFYGDLLAVLRDPVVHEGDWQLLDVRSAWRGNESHETVLAFSWTDPDGSLRYIVTVNLADHRSQGYVALAAATLAGQTVRLTDRLGHERYDRDGDELGRRGLYVDLEPWAHNAFEVSIADAVL